MPFFGLFGVIRIKLSTPKKFQLNIETVTVEQTVTK